MGSNDTPPPHVPSHVVPTCNHLLEVGGSLWTICYLLLISESFRSRSYGMPFLALAFNLAWEAVYAVYVTETTLEKMVFSTWFIIDLGLVYGMIKHARHEWGHAPVVARNIGSMLALVTAIMAVGNFTFVRWWLDNSIGKKQGKSYRGVEGIDTTELGFWSAAFGQALLSSASLAQIVVRQHSGGVSWSIWATRTLGSFIGLCLNYGWAWYFWREAHAYFMSTLAMFLWLGLGLGCDLLYPFVLWRVKKTERVLEDGRKVSGEYLGSLRATEKTR